MRRRNNNKFYSFTRRLFSILSAKPQSIQIINQEMSALSPVHGQSVSWLKKFSEIADLSGEKLRIELNLRTNKLLKRIDKESFHYIEINLVKPQLNEAQLRIIQLFINLIHLNLINIKKLLEDKNVQYRSRNDIDHIFKEISKFQLEKELIVRCIVKQTVKFLEKNKDDLANLATNGIITNLAIAYVLYRAIHQILRNQPKSKKAIIYIEPRITRTLSRDQNRQLLNLGFIPTELSASKIVKSYKNKKYIEVVADLAIVVKEKTKTNKYKYVVKALIEVKRFRNLDKLNEFLKAKSLKDLSSHNLDILNSIVKNFLSILLMDIVLDYVVVIYCTEILKNSVINLLESKFYNFLLQQIKAKLSSLTSRKEYLESMMKLSQKMLKVRVVSVVKNTSQTQHIKKIVDVIRL